ncbi:MAG: PIN domain-containing protein [Thermoleophilia bacterium]|nr:PIN domain-containing protein [Thermoleophilia bacterium]
MKVLLDTNVVLDQLLAREPHVGPAEQVMSLVDAGRLEGLICSTTVTILYYLASKAASAVAAEYEQVLLRPRFGLDPGSVAALIGYIDVTGDKVAATPLGMRLPDPDDDPFLEVAVASDAEHLFTGNLVHFPSEVCAGVSVISPAAFVEAYRLAERSGNT